MDIIQLYRDYGVAFKTEGHKHCREGWVNIPCPFCIGNAGYHLGYELDTDHFVCWRCGSHPLKATLAAVLKVSISELSNILRRYKGPISRKVERKINLKPFKHPSGIIEELPEAHRRYLIARKFDPKLIQRVWNVKATGAYSMLGSLDFKWRLFIPVLWEGKEVSFLARSIQKEHPFRYLVCPQEREIINIKKTLYGHPEKWGELGICVEGPTDVWRLGEKTCATFGIKYKPTQVRILAKTFRRVAVVFDDDAQAIQQAKKLVADLRFRGVEAFSVPIVGDPGSMRQDDADAFVRSLQTYKIK